MAQNENDSLPTTDSLECILDTSVFRQGLPHLPEHTDTERIEELRTLINEGDLLGARAIIPQIEHLELSDDSWSRLHEDTHWVAPSPGWTTHVFGSLVCLAHYAPDTNSTVPTRHSLALTFEHAWRVLDALGSRRSHCVEDLTTRMTFDQLEAAGAIMKFEITPHLSACRRLGLRPGDLVMIDSILHRYTDSHVFREVLDFP